MAERGLNFIAMMDQAGSGATDDYCPAVNGKETPEDDVEVAEPGVDGFEPEVSISLAVAPNTPAATSNAAPKPSNKDQVWHEGHEMLAAIAHDDYLAFLERAGDAILQACGML